MPKSSRKATRCNAIPPESLVNSARRGLRTRPQQQHGPVSTAKSSKNLNKNLRPRKQSGLVFLVRSRDEVYADPNRQTRLFGLPRELVQQIASDLPLASAICFTLTCKEAVDAIGTQSWELYKKEVRWSETRKAFSQLLVRDWGNILEFCPECNAMHPPLQPARNHRETKLTKFCFGQYAMIDYLPHDDFHGFNPVFSHISEAMTASEEFAAKKSHGPLIDTLLGDFTVEKRNITWRLQSSGQRTDGNLIVKHIHTLQAKAEKSLLAVHLLSLPIRLCPHQSTSTSLPERSRYIKGAELNGPLLTHAITSAFPATAQPSVSLDALKNPTPSEQEQISSAQAGEDIFWRCRSCPTKYQVHYSANTMVITSWHNFGRDAYHASKYWTWFVRRTGTLLGPDKRNDEWWSPSRTVPDFVCETK